MKILFSQSIYQHLLVLLCMVFVSSVRRVMAGRSTSPRGLILMTTYCCANAQLRERKRLCLFFLLELFPPFFVFLPSLLYTFSPFVSRQAPCKKPLETTSTVTATAIATTANSYAGFVSRRYGRAKRKRQNKERPKSDLRLFWCLCLWKT